MTAYYDSAGNVQLAADAANFQASLRVAALCRNAGINAGDQMATAAGAKLSADTPGSYTAPGVGAT